MIIFTLMISRILSSSVLGVDAYPVEVEVDIAQGLPQFTTVGLAEGAVKESKERVRSAIKNCRYEFPQRRITVNLAPADIRKEGSSFDLPISVGILTASGLLKPDTVDGFMILGELSLDGGVKKIKGALPASICSRNMGLKGIIVPEQNAGEAAVVDGIDVYGVNSLQQLVEFLTGERELIPTVTDISEIFKNDGFYDIDFRDVKGQEHVKRSLEIAASGGHNVIMVGPPGAGKTMLARRIPTILPDLSFEEALETSKIYSVSGLLPENRSFVATRPFRSPHHTISDAGLIGGGAVPKPGEVSLAHNGVLFLDELPEFKKNVIEVMRQPLEDGNVTISRAVTSITYPSSFMLVAAMNPCPCGYLGDNNKQCSCSYIQIHRYRAKVSGPLLDRFDIQVEVPSLDYRELTSEANAESSDSIRQRVNTARKVQKSRFKNLGIHSNSQMTPSLLKRFSGIDEQGKNLLQRAIEKLGLSARAYDRILKVSRTIADLDGSELIMTPHISEAIQYRTLDRYFN